MPWWDQYIKQLIENKKSFNDDDVDRASDWWRCKVSEHDTFQDHASTALQDSKFEFKLTATARDLGCDFLCAIMEGKPIKARNIATKIDALVTVVEEVVH